MNAKEYAKDKYPLSENYQIIAIDAFNTGFNSNPDNGFYLKLKKKVKELEKQNKEYYDILNDPKKLGDWIAGS